MSPADFLDLRAATRTVELAGFNGGGATLGGEIPEWVSIRHATDNLFSVLTVQPAMGRSFQTGDFDRASPDVAMIGHGLWER